MQHIRLPGVSNLSCRFCYFQNIYAHTFKIIPDEAAQLAALRAGEIDASGDISFDVASPLVDDPNFEVYTDVTGETRVMQVSVKGDGKPWDDIRVRQAMSMAEGDLLAHWRR